MYLVSFVVVTQGGLSLEDSLRQIVGDWWEGKALELGGTIPPGAVEALSAEIANISGQTAGECLEVFQNLGITAVEASPKKREQPASQAPPEPEGERMKETHPDTGLSIKEFIKKYWGECNDGNVKALFAKAQEIRLSTTLASIASAKSGLLRKDGWKPPSGSKADRPTPAPPAPAKNAKKPGRKKALNPLDNKLKKIEEEILRHESEINKLREDYDSVQRVINMKLF